ncbi:MAG: polysaccharide biosynthesis/export family protein [Lentisphaeria bacterium]|nr:polysaccharide biosynthesis/export family protein [Lentisphaeria bacterium]
MTLRRLSVSIFGTVCLFLCAGCYFERLTGKYDEIPELTRENEAVLGQSVMTIEERQRRIRLLQNLEREPIPSYTINGGDKVEIVVYNNPDLSVKTTVTPDGYIGMVLIGQVHVAGLTLGEASKKIEKALSRYIRNPKVGLSPFLIASETVTISGAITYPGIYPVTNGMRLADVFAKAGGAASRHYDGETISAADLHNSYFIRNGRIIPLDFSLAIERGDRLHNVLLRRGDYIFVAARENSLVYLIGDVKNPGRRVWSKQTGLLELLTLGGWVSDNHWSHAIIIRGGLNNPVMYKIDLDKIISGRARNVALQSGDIVYVPKDNISEYNVFIRKLMPTAQLINMLVTPATWWSAQF